MFITFLMWKIATGKAVFAGLTYTTVLNTGLVHLNASTTLYNLIQTMPTTSVIYSSFLAILVTLRELYCTKLSVNANLVNGHGHSSHQ